MKLLLIWLNANKNVIIHKSIQKQIIFMQKLLIFAKSMQKTFDKGKVQEYN